MNYEHAQTNSGRTWCGLISRHELHPNQSICSLSVLTEEGGLGIFDTSQRDSVAVDTPQFRHEDGSHVKSQSMRNKCREWNEAVVVSLRANCS